MPTYTYVCPDCAIDETVTHSMFDTTPVVCGDCDVRMRKSFHAPAATFKGEGFYSTDKKQK